MNLQETVQLIQKTAVEAAGAADPLTKGVGKMLVLSRKPGERILVGDDIKITIIRIGPNRVRVGIDAPDHLNIAREELVGRQQLDPRERAAIEVAREFEIPLPAEAAGDIG